MARTTQDAPLLSPSAVFSPVLQVAYVHDFAPVRSLYASVNSLPGSAFLVDGARPSRNSADVKAGGTITVGPHTAVFANFVGEFSGAEQF